jgi:hypothetical protein
MKASLVIFGVIFLVIGGLLYFVPLQQINATAVGNGNSNTASASVTVPTGWAYASAIIGIVLLILGLAVPGSVRIVQGPAGPRGARGRSSVRHRRSPVKRSTVRRKSRRASLPRGTSVTTTTRIKR